MVLICISLRTNKVEQFSCILNGHLDINFCGVSVQDFIFVLFFPIELPAAFLLTSFSVYPGPESSVGLYRKCPPHAGVCLCAGLSVRGGDDLVTSSAGDITFVDCLCQILYKSNHVTHNLFIIACLSIGFERRGNCFCIFVKLYRFIILLSC